MSSEEEIFLFRSPLPDDRPPDPSPEQPVEHYDLNTHIILPHCSENYITIRSEKKSKYTLAEQVLTSTNIANYQDLVRAIKTYNPTLENDSFNVLLDVLSSMFPNEIEGVRLIHKIISLAFSLESLIRQPIPILKQEQNRKLNLSQQQVSSLLANALLILFPNKRYNKKIPSIDFDRLFTDRAHAIHEKREKLKCILNYFHRITINAPTGVLTVERRFLPDESIPKWPESQKPLRGIRELTFHANEVIETCRDALQVDFADEYIGGLTLEDGLVQEEIRFVLNPELIVTRAFTEKLNDNEVLLMVRSEQFNKYTGYDHTFQWAGDHRDDIPYDSLGRRSTQIVAMDAVSFCNHYRMQFRQPFLDRELKKAYVAFFDPKEEYYGTIATGNWGCGVFNGDPRFKFLIQLLAASEAGKNLKFFTFHDQKLKNELENFHLQLLKHDISVGKLYQYLVAYGKYITTLRSDEIILVFDFIERNYFPQ